MDFTSNMTSTHPLSGIDMISHEFQSPLTLGLAGFIATLFSFLAYYSYSPKVEEKSPAFTSDTVPFIGSWRFFTHKL